MTTFLLSCIYPVLSILGGLNHIEYFTSGRYEGSYPDVFNHAFYIAIGTILILYHYILNRIYSKTLKINNVTLISFLVISILGLWFIKHMATIALFLCILIVFFYYSFRRQFGAVFLLLFLSIIFIYYTGDQFFNEVIDPRIETELQVIEGSRDVEQGMHGRISRWTWLTGEFNQAPVFAKLFGYPFTFRYSNHLIGITPHNDYLRILFFTGFAGLSLYLLILTNMFSRVRKFKISDRFILYSIFLATCLYSITTVPTFYPGFVNILMISFAYCALSQSNTFGYVKKESNNTR
jgi:hypothetical protein